MHDLLIRPTADELKDFGDPDFVIMNAGDQAADPRIPGVSSATSLMLDLVRGLMVILGTNYAGEMKKGIFTAMTTGCPAAACSPCMAMPTKGKTDTRLCSSASRERAKPRSRPTRVDP